MRSNPVRFKNLLVPLLALAMSVNLLAQAAEKPAEIPMSAGGAYQLGPGDTLRITVLKQDLLTQDGLRIGNDGTIRLLMLAEPIQAACLTEAELATVIAEKYRKFILHPQVYVTVREFNSNIVSVIGAVNSPGRFQLQRPVRLLEIMTMVNGPAAVASKELQILRTSGLVCERNGNTYTAAQWSPNKGEPEIISLNIEDVLSGATESNPLLRGGDIVRVVQAEQRQAYVVGSVRSATTVNLKDPVTLSTAIAMSGGPAQGAQLDKIKISRQVPGSLAKQDIFVNFKDIRAGERDDVLLEPNDIVDVPGPSGTKKFLTDIFRSVIPVFTRVPMVIP